MMNYLTNPEIIEENNKNLQITNYLGGVKKRINNECINILYKKYSDVFITVDNVNSIINVAIYEIIDEKRNKYSFNVNADYPFRPPKIFLNNHIYSSLLRVNEFEKKLLNKLKGINCLCCNTYNCSDNWSPSHTIDKIITEMKDIKQFKRNAINKLMADKIKLRYLIHDIDLDCYLF